MARKSRKNLETALPPQALAETALCVGAYVRLSAVDKKHKGDSIETQREIIGAYIAEQSGFELRETYIDNGLSGQSFERPAFQRMIADVESGKINCCITKDLSRLGRNAIDTGYYIEKYFPARGVRFIAVTDGYDSARGSGGLMVSLKNMVNEAYALDIGRKIRATKQMNIRAGCFIGRFAPYGYMKDPRDGHKLLPDPDAARVVEQMFRMAANGTSISLILQWLNDSGILPPRRYLLSKGLMTGNDVGAHMHWNKGALYSILKNRVYCGDMVQGKYQNRNNIQEKLPESEWVVTENTHIGIVSRDLFAKVQKLWIKSPEPPRSRFDDSPTENILLRKVFCAHCGHTMLRRRHSKTRYGFMCHTRAMYDKSDCVLVSINENVLKEKLLRMLRSQADALETVHAPLHTAVAETAGAQLRDIQSETAKNARYVKSLYENLISGVINDSEFKELKAGYEAKIAALSAKEQQLRGASRERIRQEAMLASVSEEIQTLKNASCLTAETVDKLVEKIRVFEDKRIEVKFRFLDHAVLSEGDDDA